MVGAVISKRRQFRNTSTDWYRFLGFTSTIEEVKRAGGKRKYPFKKEIDERIF